MAGPLPIDERFSNEYLSKGLSRGGGSITQNVSVDLKNPHQRRGGKQTVKQTAQVAAKTTGTAMQLGGIAAQTAGKSTKAAGRASMRAGAALSSTGVGAVVGVPLTAAGAVANAAGSGFSAAGKAASRKGRQMKGSARSKLEVKGAARSVKNRVKVSAVNASIWSWAGMLASVQVVFGLFGLGFLGLVAAQGAFLDAAEGGGIFSLVLRGIIGAIKSVGSLLSAVAGVFGVSFEVVGVSDVYLSFHVLLFAIGAVSLLVAGMQYTFSGINSLWGGGAVSKITVFIICLFGYSAPLTNIFPWVFLWTWAVWLNPK